MGSLAHVACFFWVEVLEGYLWNQLNVDYMNEHWFRAQANIVAVSAFNESVRVDLSHQSCRILTCRDLSVRIAASQLKHKFYISFIHLYQEPSTHPWSEAVSSTPSTKRSFSSASTMPSHTPLKPPPTWRTRRTPFSMEMEPWSRRKETWSLRADRWPEGLPKATLLIFNNNNWLWQRYW